MKEYTLHSELWLPKSRDEVFPFFADARNLERITPSWLQFKILTSDPIVMKAGALIEYRIRIQGFPMTWQTEIAEWNPPYQFVDTQLKGPYRLWHHTHRFEEQNGGTLCIDDVRYAPLGGALTNWLFVRRNVEQIFAFRTKVLTKLFGETK